MDLLGKLVILHTIHPLFLGVWLRNWHFRLRHGLLSVWRWGTDPQPSTSTALTCGSCCHLHPLRTCSIYLKLEHFIWLGSRFGKPTIPTCERYIPIYTGYTAPPVIKMCNFFYCRLATKAKYSIHSNRSTNHRASTNWHSNSIRWKTGFHTMKSLAGVEKQGIFPVAGLKP